MTCPRCKEAHDVLAFVPMQVIEEFAYETNPIYRCPKCRWVFSPSLTPNEIVAFIQGMARANRKNESEGG